MIFKKSNRQAVLIALGLALTAGGCVAGHENGRDAIAVSFEPQAWMVKEIAGDDIDVVTLLPAGSDPEVYQPSVSTLRQLGHASAYLTLGTQGFEQSLANNVSDNFPDIRVIDSAAGIEKIYGGHGHEEKESNGGHGDNFDPHMLTSIRNCALLATSTAETLAQLYPDRSERYLTAGKELASRLRSLDDSIRRMGIEGKTVVIRHPSLSYYSRDYGVRSISLSDNGKEVSPMQMKNRIDEAVSTRPGVMVVEKEHLSSSDSDIARQLGCDTIQVSLNSAGWLNDIMRISHEIDRD